MFFLKPFVLLCFYLCFGPLGCSDKPPQGARWHRNGAVVVDVVVVDVVVVDVVAVVVAVVVPVAVPVVVDAVVGDDCCCCCR